MLFQGKGVFNFSQIFDEGNLLWEINNPSKHLSRNRLKIPKCLSDSLEGWVNQILRVFINSTQFYKICRKMTDYWKGNLKKVITSKQKPQKNGIDLREIPEH